MAHYHGLTDVLSPDWGADPAAIIRLKIARTISQRMQDEVESHRFALLARLKVLTVFSGRTW